MSINCDVIVRWNATPEQLSALGAALWGWCTREGEIPRIYQYLDDQPLADLIAGRVPDSSQTPWQDTRGIHFKLHDETSQNRQATIERLRRELPFGGVEDVLVDGKSWAMSA